jgi:leucyl-tRNA synthetase, eubacterial and mitochondrial family
MKKYDHRSTELKWQALWEQLKPFRAENISTKPKYYVLDMFPYPSGAGLHVGHVVGYTGTDIVARYKRQKGFNVLHPMGWDSFGLPAEQYAVRTGTHPRITTEKNIDTYRRQLKSLGFSYDWEREFATSDPTYYKWTQWIFTKLCEKGLAYEAEMLVNFCPALGTVLSNEEVENGRAKEGGHLVERRPLKQWILKITAYADRLIEDLSLLDWPEGLKKLQLNWIGRSEGAELEFVEVKTKSKIKVFTTRPDTLFGATYLVLAPEHPLVSQIVTNDQRESVEAYQKKTALKSDLARTDLNLDKTGVFTGAYAVNPVNEEKIPLWISDYVLAGYGTGAIMAVPAHDERDFAFAKQFHLPIRAVIEPDAKLLEESENPAELKARVLAGDAVWPHEGVCINSHHGELSIDGLNTSSAQNKITQWLVSNGVGVSKVAYKLRDWLFSRQRYWGEPFPVLHLADGTLRVLGIDELPLLPPEIEDYKPSGDGQSPLSKIKTWIEIVDPKTGQKARRDSNTMPQWAGSCWYYLRFCDPHNKDEAWNKKIEDYWMPVDLYVGGAEHAVLHLLYARFWHKVLYDLGLVSTKEPFQKLFNQGLIVARAFQKSSGAYVAPEDVIDKQDVFTHKETGEVLTTQIEKMSKSKLNGVTPDEMIEEYGADALRLYEMFMGPLDKEKLWNTDAAAGCRRFLNRFFDMVVSDKVQNVETDEGLKLAHRLLHGAMGDIEALQFNTVIAKMMEFLNAFTKLDVYPKKAVEIAIQVLFPFAPHIASELWEYLGHQGLLDQVPYPEVNPVYLIDDMITYVVQINGKVRGKFELPKDLDEEALLVHAKNHPTIQKWLEEGSLSRVIFVRNKLLNLVLT